MATRGHSSPENRGNDFLEDDAAGPSRPRRDLLDDPLQRRNSPSPLRSQPFSSTSAAAGAALSPPLFSSSPSVTFLDPPTPVRQQQHRSRRDFSPSSRSSPSRPAQAPLIHFDDDLGQIGPSTATPHLIDYEGSDSFDADTMAPPDRSYGAVNVTGEGAQRSRTIARPNHISMPPTPYSQAQADALQGVDTPSGRSSSPSVVPGPRRMSFKKRNMSDSQQGRGFLHRASLGVFGKGANSPLASPNTRARQMRHAHTVSVHQHGADEEGAENASSWERKPKIPTILPTAPTNPYSTPIPTVPFVVLCLVCFGEFSSAGVAGPFLFFQIESFKVGGEAEVAKWAGIVSAVFFFAQFLTSLLWSSAAQKHGRRAVLLVSLIGNATSLVLFGMATNLPMAISVRLAQGLFNGAVGVAKGAVRDLTDDTNEGRAMGQLGFAWGMGGIVGPLLGGLLCNPVDKFPWLFGDSVRFKEYPYLLPCLVVSTFTAMGAFLSLFIGYDGGPRTGAIQLPEKPDMERSAARTNPNMSSFGQQAGKRASGYFASAAGQSNDSSFSASKVKDVDEANKSTAPLPRTFTQQVDEETGGPPSPDGSDAGTITTAHAGRSAFDNQSIYSRTRLRHRNVLEGGGSAYGYGDTSINTQRPSQSQIGRGRRQSQYATAAETEEGLPVQDQKLSFAQRFLLSNDDAVLSLSDLWVAAAINGDAEEYDDEDDDFGYGYGEGEEPIEEEEEQQETIDDSMHGSVVNGSTGSRVFGYDDEVDEDSQLIPRHLPPLNFAKKNRHMSMGTSSNPSSRPFMMRRGSNNNRIPSLYANTGMESNPLLSPALSVAPSSQGHRGGGGEGVAGGYDPALAGIPEAGSARNSMFKANAAAASGVTIRTQGGDAPKSLFWQLPLVFIGHYGLMSLHSSTFDQIFMAFLVTPAVSGGLGLTAAHYAELIAAMAFCQIGFQFYFYPKVGPPQGKLSHLAMMRLGTSLYIFYVLFAFLRAFLHPSTDILVMTFMIMFASIRWLANVCAFTSVSVLMNATTPPHLIALANGLAQTTSSAARFTGPLIGGMLWASYGSTGFWVVGLTGFAGFLCSLLIR